METGGIKTANSKSMKKHYKSLTSLQKRIIKKIELRDLANMELYGYRGFYKTVRRNENGAVDWDNLTEKELDLFEIINKNLNTSEKFLSKFSDEEISNAKFVFNSTQFNFSQSF